MPNFPDDRTFADAIVEVEPRAQPCTPCIELVEHTAMPDRTCAMDVMKTDPERTRRQPLDPQTTVALDQSPRRASAKARRSSPPPEREQEVFGGYRVLQTVGRGGMGIVYRAIHEASGQEVALKTVHARTPDALASIRREIHALSRVRHPGVVRILEQGVDAGRPWYSMELIEGRTLADHLSARDPNDVARGHDPALMGVLCRLARTLAFLHGCGIVHRDLTPRNVVIQPDGAPVLVDFGLSTRDDRPGRDLIASFACAGGTPSYMSPEQIRGELLDARADLYALGCILYETVAGRPPYQATSETALMRRHLYDRAVPPSELAADVDPALEALILRLLEKRARDRVGYAEDVAAALLPLSDPATRAVEAERSAAYVYRPEFSGRAELSASFDAMLRGAQEGRGARVFIGGESGVGKTRFVVELANRARARGLLVVVGECMALGARPTRDMERSTALHPLRPLLRAVIELCGSSEPTAERVVGPRGKLLAAYEPALLDLPGQGAQPDPPSLSAQAARYRLLTALRETVAALASETPLLLVLDDLQWADELSLDFLDTFPPGFLERHRVLIVGTYRSEEASPHLQRLVRAPSALSIPLGRFGAEALQRIVSDMLALNPVPPPLLAPLTAASEGNPFLASEYLRAAVEERVIVRDLGATWRLDADRYAMLSLPGSLRELIERRLTALSAPARELLDVASVLGRQVESTMLIAIAGLTEIEGMDALKELVARAFLEEVDGDLFRFVHGKLREITYEAIAEGRCRALHHRAAVTMEARGGAVDPSYAYPLLAHHYVHAGLPREAIGYLEKAGEQALAMAAYAEAAGFFQRAVELEQGLRGSGGEPVDPKRVARWQRRLGEAFYALGDLSRCAVHSSQALTGFGHPLPRSRAGWVVALVTQLGRQVRRVWMPERHAESSPNHREDMLEAAIAAARIAHHYYFAHDGVALATVSLLSVNLAELAPADARMVRPYAQLGYFSGMFRLRSAADAYFARAERNAQAAHDPNELAIALYHEATYYVGEGAWDRAHRIGLRALALLEGINNPQECEIVHTILAHAEYCTGRYADSIARCEALFASAHARSNVRHEAWSLYAGARSLIRLGELDEALDRIGKARALLLTQPELPSEILCVGLAAAAHLGRGDLAMAEKTADHGLELISRTLAVFTLGDGYAAIAEVYLGLSERRLRDGERVTGSLMARVERACAALRRFALIFPIVKPSALLASGRAHVLAGNPRRAERCFQAALDRARALSMPYEQAMAHLLLGRHGRSAREREHHLRAARSGFERLGCVQPS